MRGASNTPRGGRPTARTETRVATRTERESQTAGGGKLYYSISEVAELLNVKAHVLRYWETQFKMLRPKKNRAGNRSYRVKDVKMALRIKKLLYDEGFTIAGARRKLLDERRSGGTQTEIDFVGISRDDLLKMLKQDLGELLQVLRGEIPLEALGRREDAPDNERARRGIFTDLDLAAEAGSDEGSGEEDSAGDAEEEMVLADGAADVPDDDDTADVPDDEDTADVPDGAAEPAERPEDRVAVPPGGGEVEAHAGDPAGIPGGLGGENSD